MRDDFEQIRRETRAAVDELLALAGLAPGAVLIVGCSSSEVRGERIGSAGSEEVAAAILDSLLAACSRDGIYLAVQCCEHLNRALVVERELLVAQRLSQVSAVPVAKAGGALAAAAMRRFAQPVLAETIEADAGIDIGLTMIGMHLKRVAVPVRLGQKSIGQAQVNAARTRPKLIGGARAVYE
ncbi:MAG: TIGR01440 family protein [Sporomusaceae bacterium]|nr:TIGR01440 family protein [Sporomusaceae bacterium]